jgi:hypothetical protein
MWGFFIIFVFIDMKDLIIKVLFQYLNEQPKPRNYWNYETLKDEAEKYSKRTDFIRKSPTAYEVSKEMGIYDEITTHMPKRKEWSVSELKKEAEKYNKMSDFQKKSKGAYLKAYRMGILKNITKDYQEAPNKKLSQDDFIKTANQVHNNYYDYSLSNFKTTRDDIKIICPKHGEFTQNSGSHLSGSGCRKCGEEEIAKKLKMPQDEFIIKSQKANNYQYDYSKTKYVNGNTKVIVTCPIHGDFLTLPANHLRGSGCPKCYGTKKRTTQEFITLAKQVHGNKYDYSKSNYFSSEKPIEIICKLHGPFLQIAGNHLKGDNCPICVGHQKSNTIEFIKKSKLIHGDRFNYDKVEYKTNKTPVVITCPKLGHGDFIMKPNSHLGGSGCPICSESRGEKLLSLILKELNINFTRQAKFKDCTNLQTGKYCRKLPFDFYLPDFNTVIEYDGVQHFKSVEFWGGDNSFKTQQVRDSIKNQYCEIHGIKMIRIPYTMNKEEIKPFIIKSLEIR